MLQFTIVAYFVNFTHIYKLTNLTVVKWLVGETSLSIVPLHYLPPCIF